MALHFTDLIVDHLTKNAVMEPRLYDSPFTDLARRGPEDPFQEADIKELIETLAVVQANAEVAAA